MVTTPIPGWLAALDEDPPYAEVLDGDTLPAVSPYFHHGQIAVRIGAQLDAWADGRGRVGAEVRYYFVRSSGRWSSLLPDVGYVSNARLPPSLDEASQRPRIAPDVAVEILSPSDRSGRTRRKIETYLEFGAQLVVVLHPLRRRVALYRADGTSEECDARGTVELAPFDGLVLDWEKIYRGIGVTD